MTPGVETLLLLFCIGAFAVFFAIQAIKKGKKDQTTKNQSLMTIVLNVGFFCVCILLVSLVTASFVRH
jgi:uncharacterized membrane protein